MSFTPHVSDKSRNDTSTNSTPSLLCLPHINKASEDWNQANLIPTNLADLFTKLSSKSTFQKLVLGIDTRNYLIYNACYSQGGVLSNSRGYREVYSLDLNAIFPSLILSLNLYNTLNLDILQKLIEIMHEIESMLELNGQRSAVEKASSLHLHETSLLNSFSAHNRLLTQRLSFPNRSLADSTSLATSHQHKLSQIEALDQIRPWSESTMFCIALSLQPANDLTSSSKPENGFCPPGPLSPSSPSARPA